MTANVLTAEPTIPAKIALSTAWLTTISGNMLPNHDAAFGTMRYPAAPIVKPNAQKIKIANALDIFYPSYTRTLYAIHHRAAPAVLITVIVNLYQALVISHFILLYLVRMLSETGSIKI